MLAAGGTDVAKLTVERILDWADWYHRAKGHWPRPDSGPVAGVPGCPGAPSTPRWSSGARRLPGATDLRRLLVQHLVQRRGAYDLT